MNEVITRAKAAVLGIHVPSPPRAAAQPPVIQQVAEQPIPGLDYTAQAQHPPQQQYATPVVSEQSSKPSSFAPDPSEFNKPLYMRGPPQSQPSQQIAPTAAAQQPPPPPAQNGEYHSAHRPAYPPIENNYPAAAHHQVQQNPRPHAPPPAEVQQGYDKSFTKPTEQKGYPSQAPYRQDEGSFYSKQPQQHNPEPAPRFFNAPPRYPSGPRPPPPGMTMPPGFIQPPKDFHGPNGLPSGRDGPPHQGRSSFGGPNSQFRGPPGVHPPQGRGPAEENRDMAAIIAKINKSATTDRSLCSSISRTTIREFLKKPSGGPAASYAQDNRNNANAQGPPNLQNRPPGPSRPFLPPRDSWRGDNTSASHSNGPSWDSNVPKAARYVELSRLPTEMLRPAVLEQFLKPSVPLQVSSVKVVYSTQGIHMHTLVRFDNPADADAVISRDGELGIRFFEIPRFLSNSGLFNIGAALFYFRVRHTTKSVFDEAVDGIPPAAIPNPESHTDNGERRRDSDHSRRRSRSRSRSRDRRRGRRDPSPRKRQRSRSRERRSSRRSRSRSPKKPRQTLTRWCLQLTNVPFRCTEGEIFEWFSERVRPSKITRTFYADGNASDRWIAEFESESLMERAFGIKRLLSGRSVKMVHISNEEADELMKIEDVYGERRKEEGEKYLHEVSHFNTPPVRGGRGGAPTFFPAPVRGGAGPSYGRGGAHPPPLMGMGGPVYRGRGMGRGMPYDVGRGRGRGFFPSRGGIRGREDKPYMRSSRESSEHREDNRENLQTEKLGMASPRSPEPEPVAATDDLVASLGPKGTVVSCCGFPSDVTLEDVLGFFQGYNADQNSVRIRMGDDGVPTGECMLAMDNAENASKAVSSLSGKKLRGQVVSLQLAVS
ncbi:hypothetical protein OESDEN_08194 [Oesophagostomum dentatum]|uniref:RRM domain-containing protein n=1 Tax=Oesophagostomum dentatum TaxID=61180 RepID=A0A0B1T7Y9_OESDE|nr:hypothetical protein OESDEN_08194 [Oesophagostomum dentatum]